MKFLMGKVVATENARAVLQRAGQRPYEFLRRHKNGEWGMISEEEQFDNELSLHAGLHVWSEYLTHHDEVIRIFTNPDRSGTVLYTPDEESSLEKFEVVYTSSKP
jgi:hypothetical protein